MYCIFLDRSQKFNQLKIIFQRMLFIWFILVRLLHMYLVRTFNYIATSCDFMCVLCCCSLLFSTMCNWPKIADMKILDKEQTKHHSTAHISSITTRHTQQHTQNKNMYKCQCNLPANQICLNGKMVVVEIKSQMPVQFHCKCNRIVKNHLTKFPNGNPMHTREYIMFVCNEICSKWFKGFSNTNCNGNDGDDNGSGCILCRAVSKCYKMS